MKTKIYRASWQNFLSGTPVCGRSLLILLLAAGSCFGQMTPGSWDDIVGKKVVDPQGVTLGHVADSVLDLEHGRYVGTLVTYGGFLGLGQQSKIVPPGALKDTGDLRTLSLNMDAATFRNAPTFIMSPRVGPPLVADVAKVYQYFGQPAYFTRAVEAVPSAGQTREQLGYTLRGTQILNMPVVNLQGEALGNVIGFRDLNRRSGRLGGVVIRSGGFYGEKGGDKIVQPQVLRYDLKHNLLRLNNHEQAFRNAPKFLFAGGLPFMRIPRFVPATPSCLWSKARASKTGASPRASSTASGATAPSPTTPATSKWARCKARPPCAAGWKHPATSNLSWLSPSGLLDRGMSPSSSIRR